MIEGHPASCLGPQTAESALKTHLRYWQTSAQHWLDAASWQSSLGWVQILKLPLPAAKITSDRL